jgi:hypothetical protein
MIVRTGFFTTVRTGVLHDRSYEGSSPVVRTAVLRVGLRAVLPLVRTGIATVANLLQLPWRTLRGNCRGERSDEPS